LGAWLANFPGLSISQDSGYPLPFKNTASQV
jgi:hypothetical protein